MTALRAVAVPIFCFTKLALLVRVLWRSRTQQNESLQKRDLLE